MSISQIPISRRKLLSFIGYAAGGTAMYHAMSSLGFAAPSSYKGPVRLEGDPKGATVIILGAGLAGMVSALELRNAGYKVKILEYQHRAGGRVISIYSGDKYTELGGETQVCEFEKGRFFNPGPWRIPYNHYAILDYCKRLKVKMLPFMQLNFNAYLHDTNAFGGKPQRYREIISDYKGGLSELMAKAINKSQLDLDLTNEDKEKLLESLKDFGVLDKDYRYKSSLDTSAYRGYKKMPGGGLTARPEASEIIPFNDVLQSGLWSKMNIHFYEEFQHAMFEPEGGMGQISAAFARELGDGIIQYNAQVIEIKQDDEGVTIIYKDNNQGGVIKQERAQWCVNTIPLSVLSQLPMNVGKAMSDAIRSVPYDASVKIAGQYKRRFWEEDEHIYGGISYTNLPNQQISYPSHEYFSSGKGILLNAYIWGPDAFRFSAMPPKERIAKAIEYGSQIHPQMKEEFENGFSWAWSRQPWILGCYGMWTEKTRAEHYDNLCQIDGRIVLAGEHASYIPAWQEGAITSALDAISRLHQKVLSQV